MLLSKIPSLSSLLVTLTWILLNISSAMGEFVNVRAATHEGSGRIAFNWDVPVSYSTEMSGKQLIVRFDRPIEAKLESIQRALPGYVEQCVMGDDGQSVAFSLKGSFGLVHFPAGTAIVIDLVGAPINSIGIEAEANVTLNSTPETTVKPMQGIDLEKLASQDSPNLSKFKKIGIRTGRHADKVRLVFDWPSRVSYRVERNGNVARVIFDVATEIEVSEVAAIMPEVIGDARFAVKDEQSIVSFSIAAGSHLRDFYSGSKVVLDAFLPKDGSTATKLPSLVSIIPADSSEQSSESVISVSSSEQMDGTDLPLDVKATSSGNSPTENQSAELKSPTTLVPSIDIQDEEVAAGQEETFDTSPIIDSSILSGPISTGANATDNGFALQFSWDEPVAAAVFRRGGALWLVFDKSTDVDLDIMRSVAGPVFRDIVQLDHPTATILRIITQRGINPVPKQEGLTWLMEFAEQSLTPSSAIEASAQPDSPVGARVFLSVSDPGKVIPVTDPEMGDTFLAVPVIPMGYGITDSYEYPQFRIRPSSQGLIVEPRIDTLRVRSVRQGVGITSSRTLHISPVTDEDIANARAAKDSQLSRVVDFEPVQNVAVEYFTETRQGLESDVSFATDNEERTDARLDLARFFLAHGMAAEALGVLNVTADYVPSVKKRSVFRMYRGMANFFMARYKESKMDFAGEQLDGNDEVIFWRSLVDMALKDKDQAVLQNLLTASTIPEPYPRALRIPLAFWTIDASIKLMDTKKAKDVIKFLKKEELTETELTQLSYLKGLNNEVLGDFDEAVVNWETAIEGDHQPTKVLAALARAELLMKMERISNLDAIDELEKLRFAWRGGDFEFNLLRRLGVLYLRGGGFRQGLRTLKKASIHFQDREEAKQVVQQMSDAFAALFLRNEADRMKPVSAIALYEEFKELTPEGKLGDEMIRKLADRLVDVDLLQEASALLHNQIVSRLEGEDKARIGGQLAVIRILAKDNLGALEALSISEESGMTLELATQRTQLKARALMGDGQITDALELIEDDLSLAAEKLRTEAYWSMGEWPRASQSLRKLVKTSGASPNDELTREQAFYVMNYAIALTLGGNDRGLFKVRQDYGSGMEGADFGDAFNLIATPEEYGLIDYESIAPKVSVAENFRNFMASYKQRLEDGALSSIN